MIHRNPSRPAAHGFRAIAAALLALSLCGALAACERASEPVPAPTPETAPAETAPAEAAPAAGTTASAPDMPAEPPAQTRGDSAARSMIETFAGESPTWEAFADQPEVTWFDREPVAAPGALGAEDARTRSGRIAWVDTDPPPGDLPPETEAGVTLTGREAVEQVAFRKARPSSDYETAIRAQLGDDVRIVRIADRCARIFGTRRANRRETAFFELHVGALAPLYMEGNADRDGGNMGPGSTTFEFTRTRPDARIRDMGCVAS